MKAGKWCLNGEAIEFDTNGKLKNGQHRLRAVIKSGVAIDCVVVRGVDPDIVLYDNGLKRCVAQEIGVPKTIESVAGIIVTDCYKSGSYRPIGVMREYVQENEIALFRAYRISYNGSQKQKCNKRDVLLAIYGLLFDGADERELTYFISIVNSGFPVDGRECSSAIVLAHMLADYKATNRRSVILANVEMVLRAYSDYLNGIKRKVAYRINNVDAAEDMIERIRKSNGLTD